MRMEPEHVIEDIDAITFDHFLTLCYPNGSRVDEDIAYPILRALGRTLVINGDRVPAEICSP